MSSNRHVNPQTLHGCAQVIHIQFLIRLRAAHDTQLVFDLIQDDRAVPSGLALREDGHKFLKPAIDLLEIKTVRSAEFQTADFQHPGWKTTHRDLRANIRAGTGDDEQLQLRAERQESIQIEFVIEVEFAGLGFVKPPIDIRLNAVEAKTLGLLEPVPPPAARGPPIMHGAGSQPMPLPLDDEAVGIVCDR